MDDQRSEIRLPPRRVTVDDDLACPEPKGSAFRRTEAVSRPTRRLRPFFWLLLVVAIVAAVVWYFARPEIQPKGGGRAQSGGPVPAWVAAVQKGDMPVMLSQLRTV